MEVLAAQFQGGGYVELNGEEGKRWAQSSRSIFGDDDRGHRLKAARTSFFIPIGEVDAYGNTSTVELDQYYLLAKKTTNAMGSTMSTVSDYAKLASIMTIDANGNRVQTAPDPLGRAVGVAVLGNQGDSTGNSLDGFKGEVDQQTLDAFFTTPYGDTARSLLAKVSQRTIYDIDSYRLSGVPSRAGVSVPWPGWTSYQSQIRRSGWVYCVHAAVCQRVPEQVRLVKCEGRGGGVGKG